MIRPILAAGIVIALAPAFGGLPSAAAQGHDAFQGCWRSQQVRVFLRDGTFRDQNGDCVTEAGPAQVRNRCEAEGRRTEFVSAYEALASGRLRVSPLDPSTGVSNGVPSELQYRVIDDWLVIERPLAPLPGVAAGDKQAVRMQSISRRVRADAAGVTPCAPRGDTGLRIGRTPRSSLAMEVPAGWKPLLLDPVKESSLAAAVRENLLLGMFVRQPAAASDGTSRVLVMEDVRPGPVPVRATEFAAVKAQVKADLGPARIVCDEADRLCISLVAGDGSLVYTEFVNIAGRVVMVHAGGPGGSPLPGLRQSAGVFVRQLRAGADK
jgi:hypothetical protein